uniref:Uncharacterized protein n=1 Tax=Romanomermis culicivorax TaxID=13658 RepID=A0A915KNG3_ROMCU
MIQYNNTIKIGILFQPKNYYEAFQEKQTIKKNIAFEILHKIPSSDYSIIRVYKDNHRIYMTDAEHAILMEPNTLHRIKNAEVLHDNGKLKSCNRSGQNTQKKSYGNFAAAFHVEKSRYANDQQYNDDDDESAHFLLLFYRLGRRFPMDCSTVTVFVILTLFGYSTSENVELSLGGKARREMQIDAILSEQRRSKMERESERRGDRTAENDFYVQYEHEDDEKSLNIHFYCHLLRRPKPGIKFVPPLESPPPNIGMVPAPNEGIKLLELLRGKMPPETTDGQSLGLPSPPIVTPFCLKPDIPVNGTFQPSLNI